MDVHSPQQRSYNMSRIKSKGTKPEMLVSQWLWEKGYRYQLHYQKLPGRPDIVFPQYHSIIFVHGCFWHRHGCKYTTFPSSRKDFWETKFRENVERDKKNYIELKNAGWHFLIIWECEIKSWTSELEQKMASFLAKKHNKTQPRDS